jgi:hypothetical protein
MANVALPAEVSVDCRTVGVPPPDPEQLDESNVTLIVRPLSEVKVAPFASWTATMMIVQL